MLTKHVHDMKFRRKCSLGINTCLNWKNKIYIRHFDHKKFVKITQMTICCGKQGNVATERCTDLRKNQLDIRSEEWKLFGGRDWFDIKVSVEWQGWHKWWVSRKNLKGDKPNKNVSDRQNVWYTHMAAFLSGVLLRFKWIWQIFKKVGRN